MRSMCLVMLVASAACHPDVERLNVPPAPATDASTRAPDLEPPPVCGSCAPATSFLYAGAETGFYTGPGTIVVGCNPLPPGCQGGATCGCVLAHFAAGFCVCAVSSCGEVTVRCSFA
jgi:hypothetical protein